MVAPAIRTDLPVSVSVSTRGLLSVLPLVIVTLSGLAGSKVMSVSAAATTATCPLAVSARSLAISAPISAMMPLLALRSLSVAASEASAAASVILPVLDPARVMFSG